MEKIVDYGERAGAYLGVPTTLHVGCYNFDPLQ